jgi:hypothetical protein
MPLVSLAQLDLLSEASLVLMLPHAVQVFIFYISDMSPSPIVNKMGLKSLMNSVPTAQADFLDQSLF